MHFRLLGITRQLASATQTVSGIYARMLTNAVSYAVIEMLGSDAVIIKVE